MTGRSFDAVSARGEALARRAAARRREAVARRVADGFAGVSVRVEGDAVLVEGRDLRERWMGDMALRAALAGEDG